MSRPVEDGLRRGLIAVFCAGVCLGAIAAFVLASLLMLLFGERP